MREKAFTRHVVLLAGVVFINLPIVYMICALSFSGAELSQSGVHLGWGGQFLSNIGRILSLEAGFAGDITIPAMLMNSLITALGFAFGSTILSFLAAYVLVYFPIKGRKTIFWLIMCTLFLPLEMRILPTYDVALELGLYNSYFAIILPLIASPLALFFFYQHFRGLPNEMTEAAIIDGAGPWKFMIDILLPVSQSRIITIFTITFVIGWNQYLWPLVITSDERYFTLVRGMEFLGRTNIMGFGLALMAIVPPVILVILLQKKLVQGLYEGIH